MLPTSRAARHQRIAELIAGREIRSQSELLPLLQADGFVVTQATLSRDLVELGAVKVRRGRSLVYAVPGEGGDSSPRGGLDGAEATAQLRRACQGFVVSATSSGNLVVLRTPPGAANFVASAFDHAHIPEILGTIAGDDTILVITTTPRNGRAVASRIMDLTRPGDPGPDGGNR